MDEVGKKTGLSALSTLSALPVSLGWAGAGDSGSSSTEAGSGPFFSSWLLSLVVMRSLSFCFALAAR